MMKKLLLTALISSAALATTGWGKTAVLLSTDVGNEIDDQWAITYLLVNPEFDVRGIVSAQAPSLPAPSAHPSYEVLVDAVEHRLGMLTHPPLLEGASVPLADARTPQRGAGSDFIVKASRDFSSKKRLVVLTIGAATDVASALLQDPSLSDRIEIVAMGFKSRQEGGREFNIQNDPRAWQMILDSDVPVTIGAADVCQRDLAMSFDHARTLLSARGQVGKWLWKEYQEWYFRNVKPLRQDDYSKPWIIWDIVTLAYKLGMTDEVKIERPKLSENLDFVNNSSARKLTWITGVDSQRLWQDFAAKVDDYRFTHTTALPPCLFSK